MRRLSAKKLLCAGDDDLLRDFFFNINRKGIAIISSAFDDDDMKSCAPITDAYLSQVDGYAPLRVHVSHKAFNRWYPDKMLRRRMTGLLNKSFCGAEDTDCKIGLYIDSDELPDYLDDHRFISLRAEEFEAEWTRLGVDPLDGQPIPNMGLGWSFKACWDQMKLQRGLEERDKKIQELQSEIASLKSSGAKSAMPAQA